MSPEHSFYNKDDEIDLFELAGKLYKQKTIILLSTFLVGIIAILMVYAMPKTYSTSAVISQNSYGQFQSVNAQILEVTRGQDGLPAKLLITPETAYNLFEKQLTSKIVHRYAFEHSLLAKQSSTEVERTKAYKVFEKNLKISLDEKANTPRLAVTYESRDPNIAADIINQQLIELARSNIVTSMETNLVKLIETSISFLQAEIKSLEASFQADNLLEITQLNEALAQAKAAGITFPNTTGISNINLNGASYLLGTKLLQSRIDQVKKRESVYRFYTDKNDSDDTKPYIQGVAKKAFMINELSQIKPDLSSLQPVNIEQLAPTPIIPIKPKKSLIIALGIILGGIIGVFIALIRIAISDRQRREHERARSSEEEKLALA